MDSIKGINVNITGYWPWPTYLGADIPDIPDVTTEKHDSPRWNPTEQCIAYIFVAAKCTKTLISAITAEDLVFVAL